ncbi:hypothetical protein VCHENC03_5078 [Vibrio sp. HENC-03]|nr:hypothetical protein VCHENC03_5078 [Vibrio sp. HENC-03]
MYAELVKKTVIEVGHTTRRDYLKMDADVYRTWLVPTFNG